MTSNITDARISVLVSTGSADMSKKEIIRKIETLLFQANGDFERVCDLLSTVGLDEDNIKSCLEEITEEYNNLVKEVSWVCGLTAESGQDANANNFNDTFKLESKELALALISDRDKSYDQELFKKYKKEEMSYPEGKGVQFIRELRALSEIFTISLIRRFNEIHKFTEEEIKKLREYILVDSGAMSNNMSNTDKHIDALSHLIKNPELSVKKIYELNHRVVMVMHNAALTDLIISGKLQPEGLKEKSYEDLEKLVCTEYKDSQPIPLLLPQKKAPESKVGDSSVSQHERGSAMSK